MAEKQESQSDKLDATDSGRLAQSEGRLGIGLIGKSIMESLPIGVVTFDSELRIVEANPEAARLIE